MKLDDIDELATSIKQYGLLHPIVIRPKENNYEVVAGNRRLEASKLLRLRKINCHIIELSDKEAYEVAIVENVQHKTINPIEEAMAFNRYVENYGRGGVSELARRIGRSQEFVTKRIQLLNLPDRTRQEIICQKITPSTALEILPLDNNQRRELTDRIIEKNLTKNDVRGIVRTYSVSESSNNSYGEDLEKINKNDGLYDKEIDLLDRTFRKSITLLKSTLVNLDDILNNMGEDWIVKELLMQYRLIIHGDIDTFLKLRRCLLMKMPREYLGLLTTNTQKIDNNGIDDSIHLWSTRGIWQ